MKHKLTGIVFLFLVYSQTSFAQEKKVLRLEEAIDLGITNSKLLKSQDAKIEEATAALKEAVEKKLPSASVSGSYLRVSGGNIDIKSQNNNNGGNSNPPPKVNQAAYAMVNAALPLYMGGRIRYGIESSRLLEEAAKLDAADNKDAVVQNTVEAYANLFKANSAVRLVKENLESSRQREKDLSNLEKNGLLARNDLLKAQLQTSNVELNLLDAENNLQLANVNMDLMLGLPATTELVLDTSGIQRKNDPRVLDDYLKAALADRKDKQAMALRTKASQQNVLSVKSEKYPSVQLTGGYIAADIPHVLSVYNAVNIGLGVSYNISSLWKTKAKVQQAEARVKQAEIGEAMLDDNITLQVNKNYLSLVSYRKKIEVYAKALEQARENDRIVKNKFQNSLATTTELLDADVALLQSSLAYTLAQADAFVAYNKLLQTAGLLSAELKK
jgi:outer membrane protein